MYTETADALDLRIHDAVAEKCSSDKEVASHQERLARTEAARRISEILQRQVAPTDLGAPLKVCQDEPFIYEPILAGRRFQIEVRGAQQRVTVKIRNQITVAEVRSLADFPRAEKELRSSTVQFMAIGVVFLLFCLAFAIFPMITN